MLLLQCEIDNRALEIIEKSIVQEDCWLCHLAPVLKGYCYISLGGRAGPKLRVHRFIYEFFYGPIEEGLLICHTCDNRRCIKPWHLFAGTSQSNSDDMMAKGRQAIDPECSTRRRTFTKNLLRPLIEQGMDRHEMVWRDSRLRDKGEVWPWPHGRSDFVWLGQANR